MLSRYLANPMLQESRLHDRGYAHYEASTFKPDPMNAQQQYLVLPKLQTYDSKDNIQAGRKRKGSEVDSSEAGDSVNQTRKRISRACDQCNSLRTKCDGQQPCAHCREINSNCEYARAHKKRGRAPKKDSVQLGNERAETARPYDGEHSHAIAGHPQENMSPNSMIQTDSQFHNGQFMGNARPMEPERRLSNLSDVSTRMFHDAKTQIGMQPGPSTYASISGNAAPYYEGYGSSNNIGSHSTAMNGPTHVSSMGNILTDGNTNNHMNHLPQRTLATPPNAFNMSSSNPFQGTGLDMLQNTDQSMPQGYEFPLGDDFSVAFMGKAPMVESPDWFALTSPMYVDQTLAPSVKDEETLRYPVLLPLLPYIEGLLPQALACDLLEQYFKSSTSAYLRPSNPYILGYILRKFSILHPSTPRVCTPALLASMLWISAQISDATLLTSQPTTRAQTCHKLLELTISLLKPLIHSQAITVPSTTYATSIAKEDAALGALGVTEGQASVESTGRVQLDNIITYIHLATVVSASERKAASLRWWNAAWSLARELRLGRELPPNPKNKDKENASTSSGDPKHQTSEQKSDTKASEPNSKPGFVPEEEREERRRVWWLLYMMDRHLALCYNRPMFFLNKECEGLLQPFDDDVWQSGRFEQVDPAYRRRGLNIECTAHSVFGYFLPLMVILGEILDLNHARNRPRFGPGARRTDQFDNQTQEIEQQLESFGQSLKHFEAETATPEHHNDAVTPSVISAGTTESQLASEQNFQTKTVVAYGNHIMHVLHILLTGKWDPIAMLDDNDLWISSQSFITATGHAVSAAEAVSDIIEHDPDLSFMPFFFGVYLLQGSFLLLLFADKLQGDVSPNVVKACETIVRAHEACVATLDTQYQRNFRRVMRSALAQVRGRTQDAEQQHWRREVLALYRWTGDGTGLAL